MTWLVFHPEFGQAGSPNRGYVYITYKWKPASGGNADEAYWRLSRFNVPDGGQAADPGSEQILIQQYDRQQFHDSGCMSFGPDGYLYVGIGDEGGANDQFNVGQKIDDRLFSGILRIDVDNGPNSHPIRRQPQQLAMPGGWPDSFTANYSIPNDNPFLDAGGDYLEEFYAIGLRQPYRFSYDAVTDRFWVGESGQDTAEELVLLQSGANYGWPFREGSVAGPKAAPGTVHGTVTEPVWEVLHSAGPDGCIVGGFVYRGVAYPELTGKFISVDNVSGRIRAFDYADPVATGTVLTNMPSGSVYSGTSTIGRDHDGEPVFIKINGTGTRGRFMKLSATLPATANPVWYRFEDQAAANTSGYISDNPGNLTADSIAGGVGLVAFDDEASFSANARYSASSGLVPAGEASNGAGLRTVGNGDGDGRPGNAQGHLTLERKYGVLDDFTVELSFNPATGSLNGGYQCFLGLDGTTGTAAGDGEAGPPLQPFRLMRWGRNDANATTIPLENGDLYLNVRSFDTAAGQWKSVPIELVDNSAFATDEWYHLAIVGDAAAGTVTVYRYTGGTYVQLGQGGGYPGNLQSNLWTVGRGMYNGNPADWVADASFDEIRIANTALTPAEFLYAAQPWDPVVVVSNPPALLSETGAFSDLATLTPAAGVFPYDVNAPLWSDNAEKQRWIAIPNDGNHDSAAEKIGFSPDGGWSFPAGTVFIKHFALPTDDNDPSVLRRLETRFIVMPASGEPYGLTYKWRADGSDADLLPAGLNESITVAEAGGGTRQETWTYPGPSDCRLCHNGNAGHVLGVKTWQLNGDQLYPRTGRTANQLETLAALGWFDANYRPEHLPWFLKASEITDSSASLEERVRSYIDSNCSHCHLPGGVRAFFDARFTTPIHEQNLIRGAVEAQLAGPADRVIVPGDPASSVLRTRHASTGGIKMPPLAKNRVDEAAAQVITDWILSLPDAPTVVLDAPPGASGPFQVDVDFSAPVTGLAAADFEVLGGTAGSLTGSGASYSLIVTPSGFGEVVINLPAGRAQAGGEGNFASREIRVSVTDSSLLALLKFDEGTGTSANDSSPQENHGSLFEMEEGDWVPGYSGSALHFDTTNERVNMPNVAAGDFTISFWIRTARDFPNTDQSYVGHAMAWADLPGGQNDYIVSGTRAGGSNRITFMTGSAAAGQNYTLHGTAPIPLDEWVHVAVTRVRSTGEMKIYVNGQPDGTATGSTALVNGNPVLGLGGSGEGGARSLEGDMDQVRIHGRALEAGEILELYQENTGLPAYEQWLADRLPGLTHLQARGSDPENDGLTNFAEFAFGGDPLSPGVFPFALDQEPDGTATLVFNARKAPAGAVYQVLVGNSLLSWDDATPFVTGIVREDYPGTGYEKVTVTYEPPVAEDRLFFRIEARPE